MGLSLEPKQILFCDYQGEFQFSEILSQMGYLVDQVLPEALKHVSVGDHLLYVFSFSNEKDMQQAFKVSEKLKKAELKTPILLLYISGSSSEFLSHQKNAKFPADAYVADPTSEIILLDSVDRLIGTPLPPAVKSGFLFLSQSEDRKEKYENYEKKILELGQKIELLESKEVEAVDISKALEAQRQLTKTKLNALMQGQKLKMQTETERLKVELSEMQARLMDREAKVRSLEEEKESYTQKIEEMSVNHENALQKLREFYLHKIRQVQLESKADPSLPLLDADES